MARNRKRGSGNGKRAESGLRNGLSIGTTALIIAMAIGGPLGGLVESVSLGAAALILAGSIGIAILADIVAVAATAGSEAPFNAMASNKVPGAREALIIVRNAGRVNSICGDIIGDICGTISGFAATPVILSMSRLYPHVPTWIISMLVIGIIAFLTIGGKATEKSFAVNTSTSVILFVGKVIYYFKRLSPFGTAKRARAR